MRIFREINALLSRATIFYAAGVLIPAVLLAALAFARVEYVDLVMPWIIVYELVCLLSLILLLMARGMISDYSLKNARRLMRVAGVLGLFTALIIGGVAALRVSRLIGDLEVGGTRESLKSAYSGKPQSGGDEKPLPGS